MKKGIIALFLLLNLAACKKESLTELMKEDHAPVIKQLSGSWELNYLLSSNQLTLTTGDVMVLYEDNKCSIYSPQNGTYPKTYEWALKESLYSVYLPCIGQMGTSFTNADWNVDELTDDQLWISKVVNDKTLILRFNKK